MVTVKYEDHFYQLDSFLLGLRLGSSVLAFLRIWAVQFPKTFIFKLSFHLSPLYQKINGNIKFMFKNVFFRCNSLDSFDIRPKQTD